MPIHLHRISRAIPITMTIIVVVALLSSGLPGVNASEARRKKDFSIRTDDGIYTSWCGANESTDSHVCIERAGAAKVEDFWVSQGQVGDAVFNHDATFLAIRCPGATEQGIRVTCDGFGEIDVTHDAKSGQCWVHTQTDFANGSSSVDGESPVGSYLVYP